MPWFRTGKPVKTEFSQYSDDFYLDDNCILQLKDIPKDDQAVVDSYFGTRLEAILDQYSDVIAGMNGYSLQFDDSIVEVNQMKRDLDRCLEVSEILDNYRASDEKYAKMSNDQLIKVMRSNYNAAVEAILTKQTDQKVDEVKTDEAQKNEPEGE